MDKENSINAQVFRKWEVWLMIACFQSHKQSISSGRMILGTALDMEQGRAILPQHLYVEVSDSIKVRK